MKVFLPDRPPEPPPAPDGKDRALALALAAVFFGVECWKLPIAAARLHESGGVWPMFWWCVREGAPLFVAAYVVRGAWVGEILSGLVLLDVFMRRLPGSRFAGDLAMDVTEYRDDDPRSFYFGVALYFTLACALVVLLTY